MRNNPDFRFMEHQWMNREKNANFEENDFTLRQKILSLKDTRPTDQVFLVKPIKINK